ncbi:unnamed protein product [Mytilus coruscus]|uniref:Uncharacterized protein n=1 Tax=Mytilus coruscus TaxID=42192 RepID=A0A6J7ZWL8_MYTCO|nr:unnamed protein product [Mytilus coruscus]
MVETLNSKDSCIENRDHITQNLSTELYRYMCQNIVGTEDHVKQIRLLNAVRDNLSSFGEKIVITSGSFGEGLHMRGSDFDIMYLYRNIENSVLIPDELLIEFDDRTVMIPSSAYAYFLKFLCHYHLKNVKQCQEALQELELVIEEIYLNGKMNLNADNLLGVALQISGDTGSA